MHQPYLNSRDMKELVKLHDVPRQSRVKLTGLEFKGKLVGEFNFHSVDGMYSRCTDDEGNILYLTATTPVEVIGPLIQKKENL